MARLSPPLLRRFLAQALAALLLLQWGGAPAQALALSALQIEIDASICLAPVDSGRPVIPDHSAPWAEIVCHAVHALDYAALPPPSVAVAPVVFLPDAAPASPDPGEYPVAPRAPPLQPRAPPSLA